MAERDSPWSTHGQLDLIAHARERIGQDLTHRPFAFQAGHIPSWRWSCERYALVPVAAGGRRLVLLLQSLLSAAFRGSGAGVTRLCAWRENPILAKARRDAVCCSVRCRGTGHRVLLAVGYAEQVTRSPLRLAYAYPPYPGKAAGAVGAIRACAVPPCPAWLLIQEKDISRMDRRYQFLLSRGAPDGYRDCSRRRPRPA
jgi:hypothetical protein